MMKKFFSFFLSITFSLCVFSQAPTIQWQKCFGGTSYDRAFSMQLTADGGYILVGTTLSGDGDVTGYHGNYDWWIVKVDASGSLQWQKALGGTGRDEAYSVYQTADGGYIVAGLTDSNDGDVTGNHGFIDCWVVKLDTSGSIQWQHCYGGTNSEIPHSIQQTTDGGYIIGGETGSNDGDVSGMHGIGDYLLLKLDAAGSIQWQKCLGGTEIETAYSTQQTADGGYIMCGQSQSYDGDVTGNHGNFDYWVVKVDSSGTIQWQKSLGGSDDDFGDDIHQTFDGGYIVAGTTRSGDGDVTGIHETIYGDYWVVKLDATGGIQWQRCYGGSLLDAVDFIQQNIDGSYVVAGWSGSTDGDVTGLHAGADAWVVRIDTVGNIQWQKCYGGTFDDGVTAISRTSDGGYIFSGITSSNNGDVFGNHGVDDFWIVKLGPDVTGLEDKINAFDYNFYPNPATDELIIQSAALKIETAEFYNTFGQLVLSQKLKASSQKQIVIDVSNFSPGIYFVKLLADNGITTAGFVKQ